MSCPTTESIHNSPPSIDWGTLKPHVEFYLISQDQDYRTIKGRLGERAFYFPHFIAERVRRRITEIAQLTDAILKNALAEAEWLCRSTLSSEELESLKQSDWSVSDLTKIDDLPTIRCIQEQGVKKPENPALLRIMMTLYRRGSCSH